MSEGRIPISGLDIRQRTIKTPHIVDLSVTTPKIADVAVTIAKTDEPVWISTAQSFSVADRALTTTWTEFVTLDITIPTWVGLATFFATARLQATNSSGGVQGFQSFIAYNDDLSSGATAQADVQNGGTGEVIAISSRSISTPGSTVQVSIYARAASGTNNANFMQLEVTASGVR